MQFVYLKFKERLEHSSVKRIIEEECLFRSSIAQGIIKAQKQFKAN